MELAYVGLYKCRCGKEATVGLQSPEYKTLPPGWVRLTGTWYEGKAGLDVNPSYSVSIEVCSLECMQDFVANNLFNPELS